MVTATTTAPPAVVRLTHAMAYDSPTRPVEWLTDRLAERGYAG